MNNKNYILQTLLLLIIAPLLSAQNMNKAESATAPEVKLPGTYELNKFILLQEADDIEAPAPKWKLGCNGDVTGATVTDKPDDPDVRSNLDTIIFHENQSSNYTFEYEPFISGNAVTTIWRLKINDIRKDAKAVITFIDVAGNDTTVNINYTSIKLAVSPKYHNFGKIPLGTDKEKEFHVINLSQNNNVILDHLKFKYGNQNFEVSDNPARITISPGDSAAFKIRINGDRQGNFSDSVEVGDTCVYYSTAKVQAEVGGPEIKVTDANFGDVTVNSTSSKVIEIRNPGLAQLNVTGFTGPSSPVYKIVGLSNISESNPLLLEPGGSSNTFQVEFTPDKSEVYKDTIKFKSNAKIIDSIAVLTGRGVEPGLEVTGFDWGRKRIHRPAYPAGPYGTNDKAILLKNTGNQIVRINDFSIVNDKHGEAFLFDRNVFKGLSITPNKDTLIKVRFKPENVGEHELVLSFDSNDDNEARARLHGIGILPKLTTAPQADFGKTNINDNANPNQPDVPIRFRCIQWNDPNDASIDVSDSVIITGFDILPDGDEISTDGTTFGTEGFRFNEDAMLHSSGGVASLPVVLHPGEYLEIPADFVAQHDGLHEADLKTKSAAQTNPSSHWTGNSISRYLSVTGDTTKICAIDTTVLTCGIFNKSQNDIEITSVNIIPNQNVFFFKEASDKGPFTLQPDETRSVEIQYIPGQTGTHKAEVIFDNSSPDNPMNAHIFGKSVLNTVEMSSTPANLPAPPDTTFNFKLSLGDMNIPDSAIVKEFDVSIEYKRNFISIIDDQLQAANIFIAPDDKFEMIDPEFIRDDNSMTDSFNFTVKAIDNNILRGNIDLINLPFKTYLPSYKFKNDDFVQEDSVVEINYSITAADYNECTFFEQTNKSIIELSSICESFLRRIVYSGEQYYLEEISPNPIYSEEIRISYSVGLESYTEIRLINTLGETVAIPVSKSHKTGKYNKSVKLNQLSAGLYFVRMRSGPFISTKKLIITK